MDKNLPIKAKNESFFKKIINYIKLFLGNNEKENIEEKATVEATSIDELYKVENVDEQKTVKEINKKNKIEEIIQIVEKNPEILDTLNVLRLETIDNYYKEKIAEYRRKISNYSN